MQFVTPPHLHSHVKQVKGHPYLRGTVSFLLFLKAQLLLVLEVNVSYSQVSWQEADLCHLALVTSCCFVFIL